MGGGQKQYLRSCRQDPESVSQLGQVDPAVVSILSRPIQDHPDG